VTGQRSGSIVKKKYSAKVVATVYSPGMALCDVAEHMKNRDFRLSRIIFETIKDVALATTSDVRPWP